MQRPLGGPGAAPAKHVSFRLTLDEIDELNDAARRAGAQRSDLIRVAVREHLARLSSDEVMRQAS